MLRDLASRDVRDHQVVQVARAQIAKQLRARTVVRQNGHLAVRCLGTLNRARLDVLRNADEIVEQIRAVGLYESIWQSFGVLLPVRSVGVMGDARTYEETWRSARSTRATA